MTRSPNMPEDTPQPTTMPETSVGILLQRGGEEMMLLKVSDRFTVSLSSETAIEQVTSLVSSTGEYDRNIITSGSQLAEFTVAPQERDTVMAAVRNREDVTNASHVYQLKDNPGTLVYLKDKLTIQFSAEASEVTINAIATEFGLKLLKSVVGIANTFVFQVTQAATENPVKIANRLMGRNEVLTAEPEIIMAKQPSYRPRDTLYSKQWYLNHSGGTMLSVGCHIDVEKAWDITRGNRSIVVAIADDAIDSNHLDFQGKGKIVAPRDFKDNDFLPLPESYEESHGTACAGIAVAEETGTGIVGVAPGCALMPIRTTGMLDDDGIEELFDWAIKNNASVISCSWGAAAVYFPLSLRQRAAINHAATEGRGGKGCVIVFAAGNANRPVNGTIFERNWPSNLLRGPTNWLGGFTVHPDVITVSACTSLGKKSAYSNWGTNISVVAPSNNAPPGMWFEQTGYISTGPNVTEDTPGLGIFTDDLLGEAGYETGDFVSEFGGTSSACPVVAGVAALILSANPNLTAQEVKRIIEDTGDKIIDRDPDPQLGMRLGTYDTNGYSQWFGYGKVNAFKAVQAAQQKKGQGTESTKIIKGSNNQSIAIPDDNPNGITSAISITESASVGDIQITVNIEHEFLGDLEIRLKAPNGVTILLQNRTLGSKTQLQQTYTVATTPILQQLLNQTTVGIWQLQVVDSVQMDTGRLKSWELVLRG